jgi:hypothetical protein
MALREMPLSAVADLMAKPNDRKTWPRIESAYAVAKMSGNARAVGEQSLHLAEELRSKLESSFDPERQLDERNLRRELETYRVMSEILEKAGGYSNSVVQDSICHLMIFRLSGWVLSDPNRAGIAERLLAECQVPRVDLRTMLSRLADQDAQLDGKQGQIDAIEQDASFYQGMAPLGISMDDVLAATFEMEKLRTSALLREPSAVRLVWRMTGTEALKWVHLRGLINFFKRGGSVAELNPADITAFQRRMGSDVKQYQYPLLRIRRLSTDEPLFLVNLHRDAQVKNAFLATALK